MPDALLGTKHTCAQCEVRFYDMGRVPPACPKCGAEGRKPKLQAVSTPEKVKTVIPVIKSGLLRDDQKDEVGSIRSEDIPEMDDEDDEGSLLGEVDIPQSDHSHDHCDEDDADDLSTLKSMEEERSDISLITTIKDAEYSATKEDED